MSATSTIRDYGITMRPYLLFVSGAAGLVGLAMQQGPWAGGQLLAFAALFLGYGFGQALTDVFQVDTDRLSAPYRPLVRGTISRTKVLIISILGLLSTAAALTTLNPWNGLLVLLATFGLSTYTWFKRRFWGGPLWNAWIVALLPIIGLLSGGATPRLALQQPMLLSVVTSVFCAYAVFVLLGYFKDIDADRATGYRTLPVQFGRHTALLVSAGFAVLAAAAAARAVYVAPPALTPGRGLALLLVSAGVVALARAHLQMVGVQCDADAHPAIVGSVRGFVVLHAGLAVLLRPALGLPVLVFLALFELALSTRPERSQI